ncbi:MAG TPA: cation:proton antiporter, partial [Chryseosolibacter sp.]|nr:cation:proton antiporter [Chryseosolibacter sp.]
GRVQRSNVWSTIGFTLNGLIFMLIGLELPLIATGVEDGGVGKAIVYGIAISVVLIITRICCTLGAAVFTRIAGHFITVADRRPGWRIPFVFGWAGMRGVVSLAAALSIPVVIGSGQPFPHRNLILMITFVVILVTLVFQGLTLPWIMRKLNINDPAADAREEEQERRIRREIAETSLRFLERTQAEGDESNEHVKNLSTKLQTDLDVFRQDLGDFNNSGRSVLVRYQDVYLALLNEQRKTLHELNRRKEFDEDLIRKHLSLVDLEETKLREIAIN